MKEKQADISKQETFEDYMRNARDAFVKVITYYFPHESPQDFEGGVPVKDIRVAAENILICFDQMREKLTPLQADVSIESLEIKYKQIISNIWVEGKNHTDLMVAVDNLIADAVKAGYAAANQPHESIEDREGAEKLIESAQEACMLIIGAYEGYMNGERLKDVAYTMFKYAKAGYKAAAAKDGQADDKKEITTNT